MIKLIDDTNVITDQWGFTEFWFCNPPTGGYKEWEFSISLPYDFIRGGENSKYVGSIHICLNGETNWTLENLVIFYLAEKFGAFIPTDPTERAECMSWLFWQMGSAPYLGGGFGHFYAYAPEKWEYPINRYAMEIKRQLDVLDRNLSNRQFLCGDDYNISDIATYSWYGQLVLTGLYESKEFLDVASYKHMIRWANEIHDRPAVRRGRRVNRASKSGVPERHDASDLEETEK